MKTYGQFDVYSRIERLPIWRDRDESEPLGTRRNGRRNRASGLATGGSGGLLSAHTRARALSSRGR